MLWHKVIESLAVERHVVIESLAVEGHGVIKSLAVEGHGVIIIIIMPNFIRNKNNHMIRKKKQIFEVSVEENRNRKTPPESARTE